MLKSLVDLYSLWDTLNDTLCDDEGKLEIGVMIPTGDGEDMQSTIFPAGSSRDDVFHLLESLNERFIIGDVMEGKRHDMTEVIAEARFNFIGEVVACTPVCLALAERFSLDEPRNPAESSWDQYFERLAGKAFDDRDPDMMRLRHKHLIEAEDRHFRVDRPRMLAG